MIEGKHMLRTFNRYIYNKDWKETVIVFLTTISLYFTFTNYVYLSAVASLIILFFVPFVIQKDLKINSVVGYLFLFFVYAIVSAIIVNPLQIVDFDFYRRDGNVFITFAPLLVLGICGYEFNLKKIISNFVIIGTFANVIGIVRFFLSSTSPEYFMFFTAHNAAGGFLAMLIIFNMYAITKNKDKQLFFVGCILINFYGLYLTDSRGSLLPLFLALIIFFIEKRIKNIDIIIFIGAFLALLTLVGYVAVVRGEDVFITKSSFDLPKEFENNKTVNNFFSFNRSYTAIDRLFYLWPRAAQMFIYSPFFGTGMGTFNDEINLIGQKGILCLNVSPDYVCGPDHAHNSYLHILAENGLLGMLLVVLFLIEIKKFTRKIEDKKLGSFLLIALFYAILSGYLEHRLFTPAQMLPFILILGMAISNENYKKNQRNKRIIENRNESFNNNDKL